MANVLTPGDRGPVPLRWVLRSAQAGCAVLALASLLPAVGVVDLVPRSQLPDSDWTVYGAPGLRWSDGSLVSDRVLLVALLVLTMPMLAVFAGSLVVHRWFLPDRSTLAFAAVGLCCVGGLTVPWMFGHAAWPDRRVRFLGLGAAVIATTFAGSIGPLRVDHDVWAWWRECVVGGATVVSSVATAIAIQRILAARQPG